MQAPVTTALLRRAAQQRCAPTRVEHVKAHVLPPTRQEEAWNNRADALAKRARAAPLEPGMLPIGEMIASSRLMMYTCVARDDGRMTLCAIDEPISDKLTADLERRLWREWGQHRTQGSVVRLCDREWCAAVGRGLSPTKRRFLVRLLCDILPAASVQHRRGLAQSTVCKYCATVETTAHIFECCAQPFLPNNNSCAEEIRASLRRSLPQWRHMGRSLGSVRKECDDQPALHLVSGCWSLAMTRRIPAYARKDAVAAARQCLEAAYEHYREWQRRQ